MANKPTSRRGYLRYIASKRLGKKGEVGAQGITGQTGSQGPPGAQGPAGDIATSVNSAPGRALSSVFTPHATRPVLCMYSVKLHTVLTAIGTSEAKLELRSDNNNPPTTVRSMASAMISIGVGVSINQQSDVMSVVSYLVPPGQKVVLVAITSGNGTVSIDNQCEITL